MPGGGLRAHEETATSKGGHTLREHVGKSERDLVERHKINKKIKAASSFYNEATAEDAIAATLKKDDAKIKEWLASGSNKPYIAEATMESPIGIKVPRGSDKAVISSAARVVLIRDKNLPLGYYILTGHPI